MYLLSVNGITVTNPSKFQVDLSDIDGETFRNAKGDLVRDRVAVKRKLICEWSALTMSEISVILQAVQDAFFDVIYPDPMTGNLTETKTFYVGDRQMPLFKKKGSEYTWEGLKMNFIEK